MFVAGLNCLVASAQFVVTSELRPRGEIRYGYKNLATKEDDPAGFVSQRSRLNFGYKNAKMQTYVSLQNVSTWGDQRVMKGTKVNSDSSLTSVFEAWGEISINKYSGIRLGRQSLMIEDHRLLTSGEWNQGASFLDGMMYRYENDSIGKLRVFGSYNAEREDVFLANLPTSKLKTFNFIHFKKDIGSLLNFSLVCVISGYQKVNDKDKLFIQNTYGGYINFLYKNPVSFGVSGFYQNGENKTGVITRAYFVNAYVKYAKDPFEAILGFDMLSGQNQTSTDKDYTKYSHTFDVLLGTQHSHYGFIDQWTTTFNKAGLINPFVKTNTKFLKVHAIRVNYNYLMSQSDVFEDAASGTKYDRFLGHEIDIVWNWKINPDVTFDLGYSYFKPSESFKLQKKVPGALDNQQWAWVQIAFKPKLFDSSKYQEKQ